MALCRYGRVVTKWQPGRSYLKGWVSWMRKKKVLWAITMMDEAISGDKPGYRLRINDGMDGELEKGEVILREGRGIHAST